MSHAWHSIDTTTTLIYWRYNIEKNTDHNTTLLTHYTSVHIDVASHNIRRWKKYIRAFILAIKIYTDIHINSISDFVPKVSLPGWFWLRQALNGIFFFFVFCFTIVFYTLFFSVLISLTKTLLRATIKIFIYTSSTISHFIIIIITVFWFAIRFILIFAILYVYIIS